MTKIPARSRHARRSAVLAGMLLLGAAATAHADITGTVTNNQGVPVAGVSVTIRETNGGGFVTSTDTDANGVYRVTTSDLSFDTPPFTASIDEFDSCKPFSSSHVQASQPVSDPSTANFTVDLAAFCGATFTPSGAPDPTGNAWPERSLVLSPPNGVTYLQVRAPSGADNFALTLADGTNVGGGTDRSSLTLTAPASYTGALNLTYTDNGVTSTRQIATLEAGAVAKAPPPTGNVDVAAIVDISGSMAGTDPGFIRKDAVGLLIDAADQGDRLVGTGFDDKFTEIFPRTPILGAATKAHLKDLANKRIINGGGTDYNIGLGAAFDALSADPENPLTPKAAIFLTDGAHNAGAYQNTHLRFAFNGTGRPWPICVVQLGTSFAPSDRARLQRIARETGGTYAATKTNRNLTNLFFQCSGSTSGATTLLKKTATFKVGQTRTFSRRIKKNQRKATFFVSFGQGKYAISAIQPGGKVLSKSRGKNVRAVHGKTFAFIQVLKPKAGLWKVKVRRLPTGGPLDQATTTVTVQKRH